ncbi:MAG: hypothetical protein FJX34_00685 [Alphaproteobacteria bacterium]|nr:hypothetical protein [Alphaproteobacteria bacterium]
MKGLFATFLFLSFSAFASPSQDFVVSKVNNKAITNSEVSNRYRFVIIYSRLRVKDQIEQKILREQILDKMIEEELIRQEAAGLKIEVNDTEIRDAIDFTTTQRKQNPTQFKLFFQKHSLSFDAYLKQLETEILWSKIISETLRSKVKITDVELNEFLEQYKLGNDVRKFFLSEIIISTSPNAEQLAIKLVDELRNGADFKTLTQQFSSGIDQDIGWVTQSDIDSKIYTAISGLKKNEYSDPVSLTDGYHIFKLTDARVENQVAERDLNTAKNKIFAHKLQTLAKGYLMDLHKKAFIEKK